MSFKPDLTEEEMFERVRQYQMEKENRQLLHFDNVEQLRALSRVGAA